MGDLGTLLNAWSSGNLKPITIEHEVPTRTLKEIGITLLIVGLVVALAVSLLQRAKK